MNDAVDAPKPDADSPDCFATWLDQTVRFQPPTMVAGVNTTSVDNDPFLSRDERTIYVSSNRPGSTGFDV